jgi:glucokinase
VSFEVPEDDVGRPVLAVVIETGRLAAGLVGTDGDVLVRDRIAIPAHDVWQGLERLIGRVLAAAPQGVAAPRAMGALCSGPIDVRAGSVSPPYVSAWTTFPLRQRLEDLAGVPVVLDTVAGGSALARLRAGVEPPSFLELRLGALVDSACILDGRRLRGAHGNAGSLAHSVVDPGGRPCWCGSSGCLESYASSVGIESEIGRPLQHANASIVDRTGFMLGRAVASFAATVDVTTVYISGSVLEVMGPSVLSSMRRELTSRARLPNLADLTVVEAAPPGSPFVAAAVAVEHAERFGDLLDPATGG